MTYERSDASPECCPFSSPSVAKLFLRKLKGDLDFGRIIGFHSNIADIILNTVPLSQSSCRLCFAIAISCDAMICM